ncbi:MATE family efflux transporter [Clostridium sp.]|uniref:MATE family efflux transporter n=1 Tax=Clostridium sp. TaxID=1506 RepID=UPI003F411D32
MKKIDLTKGNVLKVLTTLAIPIIGSSLLQFTYNLVDMLWVGSLGSNAVASIGSSSFFIGLGYSINALVVTGTGIKVAHAIGRKDDEGTKRFINSGLVLNFVIGIVFALILIIFGKGFINFLNVENYEVKRDAYRYLLISAPTLFFAFFNFLYIRIFNSYGNNKNALKISAIGIIINIVLDPIFIYGLKLGVLGAAIATLIATLVMFVLFNIYAKGLFRVNIKDVDYGKVKEIIKLGAPMSFQRVLFTVVNIILARIIGSFGSDAIAAQKIGLQVESIVLMIVGGLNGAISSFIGQNYGAKEYKRINKGYNTAITMGVIYATTVSILFIMVPEYLVKIFVSEEGTINIASSYLIIIGFSQIFSSIEMISNGVFTGLGVPKVPATISIIFTLLRIPMALFLIRYLGVNGIWWSISISSILKGSTAFLIYRFIIRKEYVNVKSS